jgi:DNA segregation ATPase FtsK/SpoIIIE-like protein
MNASPTAVQSQGEQQVQQIIDCGQQLLGCLDDRLRTDRRSPDTIRFSDVAIYGRTANYVAFRIDTNRLYHLNSGRLIEADLLQALGHVTGRPVYGLSTPQTGLLYVVALNPIPPQPLPTRLDFDPAAVQPGRLLYRLGESRRGPIEFDLADPNHILIVGTTQYGKSNLEQTLLLSLVLGLPPDQLKVAIIDPKGEFVHWTTAPHLYQPIAKNLDDAEALLAVVREEVERRRQHFEQARVRNFRQYQVRAPQLGLPAYPWLFVLIDEFVDLINESKASSHSGTFMRLLTRLGSIAASTGIRLVATTTSPKADVIDTTLRGAFMLRIATYSREKSLYKAAFGAEAVIDLPAVPGRVMVDHPSRSRLIEVQSYFASDELLETITGQIAQRYRTVASAETARSTPQPVELTTDERTVLAALLKSAVRPTEFSVNALADSDALRGQVSRIKVRTIGQQWTQRDWLIDNGSGKARPITDRFWQVVAALREGLAVTVEGQIISTDIDEEMLAESLGETTGIVAGEG